MFETATINAKKMRTRKNVRVGFDGVVLERRKKFGLMTKLVPGMPCNEVCCVDRSLPHNFVSTASLELATYLTRDSCSIGFQWSGGSMPRLFQGIPWSTHDSRHSSRVIRSLSSDTPN